MKIIGLTGGIASGKSTAAAYLKELGANVIDADKIARDLLSFGLPAYGEIVHEFGLDILNRDGEINRKKLGTVIFKNPLAREKLNKILHPKVYEEMTRLLKKNAEKEPDGIVVLEIPLLIETGMSDFVDEIWLAYLSEDKQLMRLMVRDNLPREAAQERINSQMPLTEKLKFAHCIIDTGGLLMDTKRQVKKLWHKCINNRDN